MFVCQFSNLRDVAGGNDFLVYLFVWLGAPNQTENDWDLRAAILEKDIVSRVFPRISLITFKKSKFHNFLLTNRVVVISSFYKMNNNVRN